MEDLSNSNASGWCCLMPDHDPLSICLSIHLFLRSLWLSQTDGSKVQMQEGRSSKSLSSELLMSGGWSEKWKE